MKCRIVKQKNMKNTKEIRRIYKENFPKSERVPFDKLFLGVFADFDLFEFYNDANETVGFVHLIDKEEFIHVNYIAVDKKHQRKGLGSKFIQWIKLAFNKPIVVDVENFDLEAPNIEQRINRINFYYKNGFVDGDVEFDWVGTKMFYMKTGDISNDKFMSHIVKCFPTISNIKPHESNKEKIKLYLKNISKSAN